MSKALDQITSAMRVLLQNRLQLIGYTKEFPNHLEGAITNWSNKTQSHLRANSPFLNTEEHLKTLDGEIKSGTLSPLKLEEMVLQYSDFARTFGIPDDTMFWNDEIKKLGAHPQKPKLLRLGTLLRRAWGKQLYREQVKWQIETLNKLKANFLKELEQWFQVVKTIGDALGTLGLKPHLFWDMSQGTPAIVDIQKLQKWMEYLSNDKGLQRLCNLLGRMQASANSIAKEILLTTTRFKTTILDVNSSEELSGVTLGNDVATALPQEIALLSSPETEILFDLKFAESRLMCFEKTGFQSVHSEQITEREVEKKEEKGPLIICVDTSGSMAGHPEIIAKAVTLFMVLQLIEENRACYLINFSTNIECLEFSIEMGLSGIMSFLEKSFHGGTDASPAINEAVSIIKKEQYKNADVLVISDFLMNALDEGTLSRIKSSKQLGTRFLSLSIGSLFLAERLTTYFDGEWVYDPYSSSIYELTSRMQMSIMNNDS